MADRFSSYAKGTASPATNHYAIIPANSDLPTMPRLIYVNSPGTLVIRDIAGVDYTYTVMAGQVLNFRALQVRIGTTATVVGWD